MAEHGSRFGHVTHNFVMILKYFDELVNFCSSNPKSAKLFDLHTVIIKDEHRVKSELSGLGACWYLVILPLWNRLKNANTHKSLAMIDEFLRFSDEVQCSDSSLQIINPRNNVFIRKDLNLD